MTMQPMDDRQAVRKEFPTLSEDELMEAVVRLREYFEIAADMVARESRDALWSPIDSQDASSTIEERSNDSLKT
jgi:hypothetical protein